MWAVRSHVNVVMKYVLGTKLTLKDIKACLAASLSARGFEFPEPSP